MKDARAVHRVFNKGKGKYPKGWRVSYAPTPGKYVNNFSKLKTYLQCGRACAYHIFIYLGAETITMRYPTPAYTNAKIVDILISTRNHFLSKLFPENNFLNYKI